MGDIQLSKTLSWLLRHGGAKEGLRFSAEGYIALNSVLLHKSLRKWNEEDIKRCVKACSKQRFSLRTDALGQLEIRANQGHSIPEVNNSGLTPINVETATFANVIHGTYYNSWAIIKNEGLKRMTRNHIHFSQGLPTDKTVISGMRSDCQVLIYIDLKKAILDGLVFYLSENGVILCPGNKNGVLETKYFLKVVDKRTGNML